MTRLDAACERAIPQVRAPCCLNLTGAGPTRFNSDKYLFSDKVLQIDEMRAMTGFPLDEMLIGAKLYAEKINKAKGPLKLVVPLKSCHRWTFLEALYMILTKIAFCRRTEKAPRKPDQN